MRQYRIAYILSFMADRALQHFQRILVIYGQLFNLPKSSSIHNLLTYPDPYARKKLAHSNSMDDHWYLVTYYHLSLDIQTGRALRVIGHYPRNRHILQRRGVYYPKVPRLNQFGVL